MDEFEFSLNDQVEIIVSGETGLVVGRAQYMIGENSYLIRYKAGDGRATEAWWNQSALYPKEKKA